MFSWRKSLISGFIAVSVFCGAFSFSSFAPLSNGFFVSAATLQEGSTGSNVVAVQKRLIELGYLTGNADGIFGPKTTAAVKAFQKKAGLTVDGLVGDKTSAAIKSSSAPKADSSNSNPEKIDDGTALPQGTKGTITADLLNVRSGPATSYSKITTVARNSTVTLLSLTSTGWYKIQLSNGKQGYVSKDYVKTSSGSTTTTTPKSSTATVTADVLNIRKSPDGTIFTTLRKNTVVMVLSTSNGWSKIQMANGQTGYASTQYLKSGGTMPGTTTKTTTNSKSTTTPKASSTATVTADVLNIRKSPDGTIFTTLRKNTVVIVLSTSNGWSKIQMANGQTGYASSQYLKSGGTMPTTKPTSTTTAVGYPFTGTVTATVLNVRRSAVNGAIFTTLTKNTVVQVLSSPQNGWYNIKMTNGQTGFVSAQYIKKGGVMPTTITTATTTTTTAVATTTPSSTTPSTPKATTTTEKGNITDPSKTIIGTVKTSSTVLNVRNQPTTSNSKVIATLPNGSTVTILETLNGWYKIKISNGTGYVSADYITNVREDNGPTVSFPVSYHSTSKGSTFTRKISQNLSGVKYKSNRTSIATVNETTGAVKAVNHGLATITATYSNGNSASYIVVVVNPNKNNVTAAMNAMQASTDVTSFIAKYEGGQADDGRFYKYQDVSGYWTIGYGHLIQSGEEFPEEGLSKEEAEALLHKDLQEGAYVRAVREFAIREGIILSQNQFDALVSFTYNLGPAYWQASYSMFYLKGALFAYRNGANVPKDDIVEGFSRYHLSNGVKYAGLYYRRLDEAEMFYAGDYKREGKEKWKLPAGNWK